MRIINLAICNDNKDPKGLGRIRYLIYADSAAFKERAFKYVPWDENDLFIAAPFLPTNINFIPEIGQAVKIISYDTETETVNAEYISGPFSTSHDFNSQTFSQQIENTSFGTVVKKRGDIKSKNDKYIDPKSKGVFATPHDYAIYGKNGSDIFFTENGLQLRGGKLVSKESFINSKLRDIMITTPLMATKSSRLYLKKFPKKMTLDVVENTSNKIESKILNYIVEYTVNSLSATTQVDVYVYKVNSAPSGTTLYQTNYFTEYTELYTSGLTLQNLTNNTGTTPTFTVTVDSLKGAYHEIRDILNKIHDKGLHEVNQLYDSKDLHPLYFRPTSELQERIGNDDEKETLFNNIEVRRVGPRSGLVWSQSIPTPPRKEIKEKSVVAKLDPTSSEQSFGTVISDNIYLLSTDTNEAGQPIKFDELDKYDLTQEDYIKKIEPNTYSTVRGENLLNMVKAIIDVLQSHRHNINDPYARQDYQHHNRLMELYNQMENDILNRSIRIN
jgi:hypothetical protein